MDDCDRVGAKSQTLDTTFPTQNTNHNLIKIKTTQMAKIVDLTSTDDEQQEQRVTKQKKLVKHNGNKPSSSSTTSQSRKMHNKRVHVIDTSDDETKSAASSLHEDEMESQLGDDEPSDGETLGSDDSSDLSDEEEVEMVPPTPPKSRKPLLRAGPVTPRSRNFVFTLNNYVQEDIDALKALVKTNKIKYIVFGKEKGNSGTPHLQGFVTWTIARTLTASKVVLGNNRLHLEIAKFPHQAAEYCKKDGDFWEWGVPPKSPTDLQACRTRGNETEKRKWAQIKDLAQKGEFDDIDPKVYVLHLSNLERVHDRALALKPNEPTFETMYWFYGPTGTGKSRTARERWPTHYLKSINKWWDNYLGEETVIIDEWDVTHAFMCHYLKLWSDHYEFPCERKNGSKKIRPKRIVITSNFSIRQCFPTANDHDPLLRRFEQWYFPALEQPPILDDGRNFNPQQLQALVNVAINVLPSQPQQPQVTPDTQELPPLTSGGESEDEEDHDEL